MERSMMVSRKVTLGTKEWADSNVNCYLGCSHDCRYCYAKKMAIRFKRKTEKTWRIMVPNYKNIRKGYRKRTGRIMFPTSHDITLKSLDHCRLVLRKLLQAKNNVLITSKPNLNCITLLCKEFESFKAQIQFRFTITSCNDEVLKFWEPGAPTFNERLQSLTLAHVAGFKTSVSIEPFLDKDPFELIEILYPYVTESIWIGKMNYISSIGNNKNEQKYSEYIKEINSTNNLKAITLKSKKYIKVKINIKDSINNELLHYKLKKSGF